MIAAREELGNRETSQHRAHAAGDIEPDAAGRNDAALVGIEGRHAADGKAVAPMGVGHGIGCSDNARQRGDVCGLLVDLIVHVADQVFVGIDDRRHTHGAVGSMRQVVASTRVKRSGSIIGSAIRPRHRPPTSLRFPARPAAPCRLRLSARRRGHAARHRQARPTTSLAARCPRS